MESIFLAIAVTVSNYFIHVKTKRPPPTTTITESAVVIGNSGDHINMSTIPREKSETEREIIRIYSKLDTRHKADFLCRVYEYERDFDDKQKHGT